MSIKSELKKKKRRLDLNSCISHSENFLSFSPSLTALKQEPQTEQLKPNTKLSLDSGSGNSSSGGSLAVGNIGKIDKSPLGEANHSPQRAGQETSSSGSQGTGSVGAGKHELNSGNLCGCGSPQGSPAAADFELNGNGNAAAGDNNRAAAANEAFPQARKLNQSDMRYVYVSL